MNAKRKAVLIFGMLILFGVAALPIVSRPSATQISEALGSTVIEHLALKEVPVPVAVSIIDSEFRRKNPKLRKVRLVTNFDEQPKALWPNTSRVTADLRNIPADEAFRLIAGLANCRFVVHSGGIYFGDRPPLTISERLLAKGQEVYWRLYFAFGDSNGR